MRHNSLSNSNLLPSPSPFSSFFPFVISICIILFSITIGITEAKRPDRIPCLCGNGSTRDLSVDYCYCTACDSSVYVRPFCTFRFDESVSFAISYNWTGHKKTQFPFYEAEREVKDYYGIFEVDFNRLQRGATYEVDKNDFVMVYLVRGSEVDQIYRGVYAKSAPFQYPSAYDIFQLGTIVSKPGIFAEYFSQGIVLAEVKITDKTTFGITDRQVQFVLGTIVILIATPLLDRIAHWLCKKTPEELDEEEMEHSVKLDRNEDDNDEHYEEMEPPKTTPTRRNNITPSSTAPAAYHHVIPAPPPPTRSPQNNNNNNVIITPRMNNEKNVNVEEVEEQEEEEAKRRKRQQILQELNNRTNNHGSNNNNPLAQFQQDDDVFIEDGSQIFDNNNNVSRHTQPHHSSNQEEEQDHQHQLYNHKQSSITGVDLLDFSARAHPDEENK